MNIKPFLISAAPDALRDLRARLELTRWNDSVAEGWSWGTDRSMLQLLVAHWRASYDWPQREDRLNALPHFRADVGGFGVHFLHYKGRGPRPAPLLLINGWPSSFVEYQNLAPRLADPGAFGGDPEDAFDVVIPALPGYGFSDRPAKPQQVTAQSLFHRLMTEGLGYSRFGVAGTDIGAGVAAELGHCHPEAIAGIHVTTVDVPLGPRSAPLSPAEIDYQEMRNRWRAEEGAYSALQRTKPQTLAFGLADSPVGLASWIVEKFHGWSDCRGELLGLFPLDMLIDNIMIYWLTGTIGSSVRYYYEQQHRTPAFRPGDRVKPPAAVLTLPKELAQPPREWAERLLNVVRYTALSRGGHFPGWEVPELYAADLQAFFRPLRP